MIQSLLIANRGEIVVRIARTCREMGIRTIGVFSEADRRAWHVQVVDEAYCIGDPPARESYLNQERLLDVARRSGAEAIHPGYGFLAENSQFAAAVAAANLIWVGPPASAIAAMGLKTGARRLMTEAGVPVVPGSDGPLSSTAEVKAFGKTAGYPILLKASAGGGGKGMRVVSRPEEVGPMFEAAQREALAAFGDDTVYAEKFLARPRHIEFQILADTLGNVVHLGERECSLQRRHQKIIEEAPSTAVSPELRERMGETAVRAARACGYVNAGTVEMMLDSDGHYYFLEMNTRLQVEHPVTEEITGLDLVQVQMKIASGERLPITQNEVTRRGHAIEVRVYAEDPAQRFLPSTGVIKHLRPPGGPGIREDSGLREGGEVTRFYDPMISKLIARAADRESARRRMVRALEEYEIAGVRTNIPFCRFLLESEAFRTGRFDTGSVDRELLDEYQRELEAEHDSDPLLAALVGRVILSETPAVPALGQPDHARAWSRNGRLNGMSSDIPERGRWNRG
jgi:acetyl-CoA carboxylase biotin carboxylase subunit